MEEATKIDKAEMTPVMEKMVPRTPSDRPNLRLKKYVTQDLEIKSSVYRSDNISLCEESPKSKRLRRTHRGANPEARLSKANSTQS
jgi:hypothetical protein